MPWKPPTLESHVPSFKRGMALAAAALTTMQSAPAEAAPKAPQASEVAPGGSTPEAAQLGSSAKQPSQPVLMREGTYLTRALGTIDRDQAAGTWTFTTVDNSKDDPLESSRTIGSFLKDP